MSSPILFNIFQHDAEMLKEQCYEMQWWQEKEQQLLVHLQETVEAYHVEHAAQKARREVEAKAKVEAKRQRLVEEEKKKKQLEYLQQLQNKVLAEGATLLEGTEEFQVMGSKYKEVTSGDEKRQWPFKKAREKQLGKHYGSITVKMRVLTPVRGVCAPGRIVWYTTQDEYLIFYHYYFL